MNENSSVGDRPLTLNIVDVLGRRASSQAAETALTFLEDGEGDGVSLTFGELHRRARAIAAALSARGLAGKPVMILQDDGLEYMASIFGCFMAGAIAVPAFGPRGKRQATRLESMVVDSGARTALVSASTLDSRFGVRGGSWLEGIELVATDAVDPRLSEQWREPELSPGSLALLQYTSGSTREPRGVMITHGNVVSNLAALDAQVGERGDGRAVQWLPLFHDMGLVTSLYFIYAGFHCVQIPPAHFTQKPLRWLSAISRYRASYSGGPNFAFDLCEKTVREEELDGLDLSCWSFAFTGAEPVRHQTLEGFARKFRRAGFQYRSFSPCYGLAEFTLAVTGGRREQAPSVCTLDRAALQSNRVEPIGDPDRNGGVTLVGCGVPWADSQVLIVDPEKLVPLDAGRIGEVWVRGSSQSAGYWNRPEETERLLRARLSSGEGPYLRTGDLGFLRDDELFVTGRLKDLIIIWGANYLPQDIEWTVSSSHPALESGLAAAFSVNEGDAERLVIVKETGQRKASSFDDVFSAIREDLAGEHELQVYAIVLVKIGSLPRTSSGKVQRHLCRRDFLGGGLRGVLAEWRAPLPVTEDESRESPARLPRRAEPVPIAIHPPAVQGAEPPVAPEIGNADAEPAIVQPGARAIQDWLVEQIARRMGVSRSTIALDQPFVSFGISSLQAVNLTAELGAWLGRPLEPALAWNYPSIRALSRYLAGETIDEDQLREVPVEVRAEPMAVIGMACRFPGADTIQDFWNLLRSGGNGIVEVPSERWPIDDYFDPNVETPGMMVTRWGGFLKDVERFDASFFGITPREAAHMDPQQSLLLEVCWEAFENAGITRDRLSGSHTGVFLGIGTTDFAKVAMKHPGYRNWIDAYTGTGNALSIAANRVSYLLDLRGPSLSVDTACSSALVALHLACQSLQRDECSMAVVGAVNLILSPDAMVALSKARMLSPTGQCKVFDAGADGYVRGEGCGVVVLKPLSDALKDGDEVLAVIRGTAVNQDGRTSGISAPNGLAQQAVIRSALRQAGVSPDEIGYVEAHGTGTPIGDPIEVAALSKVFSERSNGADPCFVGSVKANVGHLETAAGIVGIIKTVLMLQHKEIPPQRNLHELNPHIKLSESPFAISTELVRFPERESARFAGVSSFGFGGTNSHAILEAAPDLPARENAVDRPLHLMAVSAQSEKALAELTSQLAAHLEAHPETSVSDFCYTTNSGRTAFPHRMVVRAIDSASLTEGLRRFASGERAAGVESGHVSGQKESAVGFLFTGQGSQYPGMSRLLYETQPTFRRAIDHCAELLKPHLDRPLRSVLYPASSDAEPLIHETAYTQPALFAVEYALSELWGSWGVDPQALLGHSVGEYVAACRAGVFSLETALRLVAERARLMQSTSRDGLMAVVMTGEGHVRRLLSEIPGEVSIAAVNGPESIVISGRADAVRRVVGELEGQRIPTRWLTVSHAFHSPLMEPILDEFERFAGQFEYHAPLMPVVSNLTGRIIGEGETMGPSYWRRHLREPVQFFEGMKTLAAQGCNVFVELGPQPNLTSMGRLCLPQSGLGWLSSLKEGRDDWQTLLRALGEAYLRGVAVNWSGFDRDYHRKRLSLPTYPFQRARYWAEPKSSPGATSALEPRPGKGGHPLLGGRLRSELAIFETLFDSGSLRYLQDHRLQGSAILPATAYMELALAAAAAEFENRRFVVENLSLQRMLFLSGEARNLVQVLLSPLVSGEASFRIVSQTLPKDGKQPTGWTLLAVGSLRLQAGVSEDDSVPRADLEEIRRRCEETISGESYYQVLRERGHEYGPAFQGIQELWRRDGEALGRVRLPSAATPDDSYHVHPALLDACLQIGLKSESTEFERATKTSTYVPMHIRRMTLHAKPGTEVWVRTLSRSKSETDLEVREADMDLFDAEGRRVASLEGIQLKLLSGGAHGEQASELDRLLYDIEWRSLASTEAGGEAGEKSAAGTWLLFADSMGAADRLASALGKRGGNCLRVSSGDAYARVEPGRYEVRMGDPSDLRKLFDDVFSSDRSTRAVVYLGGLDTALCASEREALAEGERRLSSEALHLMQQLAAVRRPPGTRLFMVTQGAHAVGASSPESIHLAQSLLWGMGRTAALEHAEWNSALVDLSPGHPSDDEIEALALELLREDENQIVLRGRDRWAARLVRRATEALGSAGDGKRLVPPSSESWRLEVSPAKTFESLTLKPAPREKPQAGWVEVRVRATGLNFSDVLKAMGLYPGVIDAVVPLGIECSGVVTAVGDGVTHVAAGDEILGCLPYSFGAYALTPAYAVARKPPSLSFEEAATIPVTFLTAYYALVELGRIRRGERVLIHAGAGGVGLAAIQIAKHFGAEIFTTAGSEEKREYLRSLGIQHVMSSRTLSFVDEILEITRGEGVDLVLNSLPGEAAARSLQVLGTYGRFLEIGKIDIYQNRMIGLAPFKKNLSYYAIDVDQLFRQKPDLFRELLTAVMDRVEASDFKPLPFTTFPIEGAIEAFRFMSQRRNIGKIVVSLASEAGSAAGEQRSGIRADATYLITGGLGAIGLRLAQWLAERGARNLVLVSRRSAEGSAAETVRELREGGARVELLSADVSDRQQVDALIRRVSEQMPPLCGIFHAAGVLDDGILLQLDAGRFRTVLAPKVDGAWNLHEAVQAMELDYFVLFSSIASVLGAPGQGNYAAANAFLDALAHYRRSQGMPALSINWGPWAEAGMAARTADRRRTSQGLAPLPSETALGVLDSLLSRDSTQMTVAAVRLAELSAGLGERVPPLFRDLASEDGSDWGGKSASTGGGSFRGEILACPPDERVERLRSYLVDKLAQVIGCTPDQVDSKQPLNALGLDSLMSIELKNGVESALGISMPIARFLEGPTLEQLADDALGLLVQTSESERGEAEERPSAWPLTRIPRDGELPLSFAQQRLWFVDQLLPRDNAVYNLPTAVRFEGPVNLAALQRTIEEIVDRHESLRTTFSTLEGRPIQVIAPSLPGSTRVVELASLPRVEREAESLRMAQAEARQPFDLARGPLLRVTLLRLGEEDHVLLWSMHHIVADGWSIGLLIREIAALYRAYSQGLPSPLPELPIQYADFAYWQRHWLKGEVLEEQLAYWQRELAHLPVLEVPTDRPRPAMQTFAGARADFELGPSLLSALEALSEGAEVTLFMTVLAAFQTLLSRYSGQDDVVVGSAFANRNRSELEGMVGFVLNNLVLRTNLGGNPTFRELLPRVRERCLSAYANQDIPFENLVERLQTERDLSREPLFQVAITLEKGVTSESVSDDLTLSLVDVHTGTSKFDITLFLWKGPEKVTGRFEYKTDLFDGSTMERLIGHFETLLQAVVENPERRLSELDLLTEPERHQLMFEWEAASVESLAELTIPGWFAQQARRRRDAVAVVEGDRQLSYGALDTRANRLAHYLRALGVGPDVRVGICVERSLEMVVGILGILKAGGAYVPLDPDYPLDRLAFVLADSRAHLVLTQERLSEKLTIPGVRGLCLDSDWERIAALPGSDPAVETGPAHLAYVIYTSGSTGRPKGCLLTHGNVVRLLTSTEAWFEFEERDVWTLFHSYAFDFSVWEIWGALFYGGRLIVVPHVVSRSPEDFHELLVSQAVSVLSQTPSSFYRLMEVEAKKPELATHASLRWVVFGGEALDVERLEPWFERHGERWPRLVNMYGITETTVHVTYSPLSVADSHGVVRSPIGRQIPDLGSYVLDADWNPLPAGVAGELSVSGAGLARGYQNRPDLTAERFVPHPFGAAPGERLYRTGDLVRWLADATLEYLGRIDHQVKLRGFRIELGEIESMLRRHEGVREAVVVAREDQPDQKQLVAYVVLDRETKAELSELRSHLKARLPEYMIPSSFVEMESLPLTRNKKLDRKALPVPGSSRPEFDGGFVAPGTDLEKRLARVWSEVLGVDRLGIHDNFFDLGGHSLLATVMISRLKEELDVEVELNALFETPTLAGLSVALAAARNGGGTPAIEQVSRERELPLSFAQQRLWFLDQLAPSNPVYNIPFAVRLNGRLDVAALRRVFAEIVRRHESLRTTFAAVDGHAVQKIAPSSTLPAPLVDLTRLPGLEREAEVDRLLQAEAHRPFDLMRGPLLRVRLLRVRDDEHIVSLNIHHIVSDDWSMGVIVREMIALYRAYRAGRPSPLAEPPIQYADYASWQRKWLAGEVLDRQMDFWVGALEGGQFDLALPTDRPRPKVQTYSGASRPFELTRELTESLRGLGARSNASLFMTLLAAFQTLLSRYSGQDEICVGSPIAGRNRAETEGLVGLFVNTLVLRGDLSGNPSFEELLARTRETTLSAYAHQDLPFEQLVQRLQPERDMRRTPLFQVVLSLHNVPMPEMDLPELSISPVVVSSDTAKFDLCLELEENQAGLKGWLEYNTDLFDRSTIDRMLEHLRTLLEQVASNPRQRLLDIPFAETEGALVETPLHPSLDRDEAFDFGGFR